MKPDPGWLKLFALEWHQALSGLIVFGGLTVFVSGNTFLLDGMPDWVGFAIALMTALFLVLVLALVLRACAKWMFRFWARPAVLRNARKELPHLSYEETILIGSIMRTGRPDFVAHGKLPDIVESTLRVLEERKLLSSAIKDEKTQMYRVHPIVWNELLANHHHFADYAKERIQPNDKVRYSILSRNKSSVSTPGQLMYRWVPTGALFFGLFLLFRYESKRGLYPKTAGKVPEGIFERLFEPKSSSRSPDADVWTRFADSTFGNLLIIVAVAGLLLLTLQAVKDWRTKGRSPAIALNPESAVVEHIIGRK